MVNTDSELPCSRVIPTTTYSLNWKLVLNPNFNFFRSMIGLVNGLVDPLFSNAPAETIMFVGYGGKRTFLWSPDTGATTVTPWDLTFKFVGRHINSESVVFTPGAKTGVAGVAGWNHVFRPATGNWERPVKADKKYLYDSTTTWGQMFRTGGLL